MKKIVAYLKLIAFVLASVGQILAPLTAERIHGEKSFFEDWSPKQAYTEDYAVTIEKDPDKDFVILNLTDPQINAWDAFDEKGMITTAIIDEMVEKTQPDLITVTGDNAWNWDAYLKLVQDLDKFGIPWAPVMGNHDGEGCPSEFWCAYQFYAAKNCVFKFGPKDMGYGNYIINITENGKIIHTLYMMDTHSNAKSDSINAAEDGTADYDHLWKNQIAWYKWAVNGTNAIAGQPVESSVFIHIPLYEYRQFEAHMGEETSFGENREPVCSPEGNNGFFTVCKELGSTKNVVCGHEHINSVSFVLDGIRLTYALKTGAGCYWDRDMSGGTTLTVDSNGHGTIQHVYSQVAVAENN